MHKIERLDSYARGITKIDNKICFVDNALPLEECEIEIIKENKKYLEAKNKKIIKESDYRIMPLCPYYYICGGCHTMHMDRKSELIFKEDSCKGNSDWRNHTANHDSSHDHVSGFVLVCEVCKTKGVCSLVKRTAHICSHHSSKKDTENYH